LRSEEDRLNRGSAGEEGLERTKERGERGGED